MHRGFPLAQVVVLGAGRQVQAGAVDVLAGGGWVAGSGDLEGQAVAVHGGPVVKGLGFVVLALGIGGRVRVGAAPGNLQLGIGGRMASAGRAGGIIVRSSCATDALTPETVFTLGITAPFRPEPGGFYPPGIHHVIKGPARFNFLNQRGISQFVVLGLLYPDGKGAVVLNGQGGEGAPGFENQRQVHPGRGTGGLWQQEKDDRGHQQEPDYLEQVKHFSHDDRYPVSKIEMKTYSTTPSRSKGKKRKRRNRVVKPFIGRNGYRV